MIIKMRRIKKTLRNIVLGITLGISLGFFGCDYELQSEKFDKPYAYYVTALDGSKVLVVADPSTVGTIHRVNKEGNIILKKETNYFKFYRDKDHDGWADSKGESLYWSDGLADIIREEDVPDKTYNLEEIKEQYSKDSK